MSMNRKKDEARKNGSGASVKLRWMELDVEGGTADLVEGFKSFATALRAGAVSPQTRLLAAPKHDRGGSTTAVLDSPPVAEEEMRDRPEAEATEEKATAAPESGLESRKRRPAPKAPRFLGDLDLTKSPVQLADFVREKGPAGDMDRFAVIAAWFKQYLSIEEVTIDHIFTAYKALGWQAELPDDLGQTFRNLKSNKNWFDSGATRGAYKINWNGEGAVNKMGAGKP
jgi:hypothetical protein